MARILVVEDERVLAKNFAEKLRTHEHQVKIAHTCKDALSLNTGFVPDVIILDLRLPDGDGLKMLPELKSESPSMNVIVVTAHGSERIAVEAMRAGAFEYLTKPVDLEEMEIVVTRAVDHQQINDNLRFLRDQEDALSGLDQIIGHSEAIRSLKESVLRLTRTKVLALTDPPTVLITGETGTGKDLTARAIHYHGPRRNKPFIHVNCTALPAALFESELFGHLRGAFTSASQSKRGLFEVAEGGTLFLNEIGHLGLEMQAKLLHAIEHREIRPVGATESRRVNVHVIAATNRDLDEAVEAGEYRSDLYHRLRVVQFHLSPLRDRQEDTPLLASHFLARHCRRFGLSPKRFTEAALCALSEHPWRGNVRELSHTIESCLLQLDGPILSAADLRLSPSQATGDPRISTPNGRVVEMDFAKGSPTLDEVEQTILLAAYEYTGRNLSRAARILGITREALRYRLNKNMENAR